MRNVAARWCLLGLLSLSGLGCIAHEGQAALYLTTSVNTTGQALVAAQQVNVEITSVAALDADSGEYIVLAHGSQVYELIGLTGRSGMLALAGQLTEGDYTQIRLTFSDANSSVINDAGRRNPLLVEPQEVKVPVLMRIIEDTETDVVLDIDLSASLNLKNNGVWVLRPVVRQAQ